MFSLPVMCIAAWPLDATIWMLARFEVCARAGKRNNWTCQYRCKLPNKHMARYLNF